MSRITSIQPSTAKRWCTGVGQRRPDVNSVGLPGLGMQCLSWIDPCENGGGSHGGFEDPGTSAEDNHTDKKRKQGDNCPVDNIPASSSAIHLTQIHPTSRTQRLWSDSFSILQLVPSTTRTELDTAPSHGTQAASTTGPSSDNGYAAASSSTPDVLVTEAGIILDQNIASHVVGTVWAGNLILENTNPLRSPHLRVVVKMTVDEAGGENLGREAAVYNFLSASHAGLAVTAFSRMAWARNLGSGVPGRQDLYFHGPFR
ncbi:hypothetical protein B0H10DRAFT_2198687 [Mycena sp. CBHHK59/15]|nr:hypothetical protein B0H10DRAFT_2198687 [Mycena sp. CBHHK59/15]